MGVEPENKASGAGWNEGFLKSLGLDELLSGAPKNPIGSKVRRRAEKARTPAGPRRLTVASNCIIIHRSPYPVSPWGPG